MLQLAFQPETAAAVPTAPIAKARLMEPSRLGACTTFCWTPYTEDPWNIGPSVPPPAALEQRDRDKVVYHEVARTSPAQWSAVTSASSVSAGPLFAHGVWMKETTRSQEDLHTELRPVIWNAELPVFARRPDIEIDKAVQPLLTDREREALGVLLPFLEREARRNFVPLVKLTVRRWVDPEEGGSEVVVRQRVDLHVQEALEYWDLLWTSFEDWEDRQPQRIQETIRNRIGLDIFWNVDE